MVLSQHSETRLEPLKRAERHWLKGGGGGSELLLAVSLISFWNPTLWFTSTGHSLPRSNDWAHALAKHQQTRWLRHLIRCSLPAPAPGPCGLRLLVANLGSGIFALLVFSLIALLDLTVQFQPAFYTSERIIRSCHVYLLYLIFFFHFKSCSNCQVADLSSWRVSPLQGIFSPQKSPWSPISPWPITLAFY